MNTESKFLKIGFLALALILLTACPQEDKIVEPAGQANYFINNQTDIDLYYGIGESAVIIEPNSTKLITQDGGIGTKAPLPSDGLGGRLHLYSNSQGTLVFEQDPVKDSDWIEERQDDQYYGLVHYTFVVTAEMLN